MQAAHATAATRLRVTCTGHPVWGFAGSTIGRRAGAHWLRVAATSPTSTRTPGHGITGAEALLPASIPRPRLHGTHDWTDGGHGYQADLLDYITNPIVSSRPNLTTNPRLPDLWWYSLRRAVEDLAAVDGVRTTVRNTWIERAFPQFLGIPAPTTIHRATGHGDLHWANLTGPTLTIIDWERWGCVPFGFDVGLLHANSLLDSDTAVRVRYEFRDILDTPAGRIGELSALAEMLQAVARGWYPELAAPLARRAHELTGVMPPVGARSELSG
ncbi:aminoglycoside phosphotransferase family protein [Kitasatospora sp. NRRL B-11411]|uniref:aminoglycoside phosphotransferase family protein n=1 Tax=Kitasatospora sp. NRRL B-11411 TaxID=1463822 RepID=UPI001E493393|nr:aminoglycoside phosphotransferase family protein [Kitasatospora sp. NRRL B-11411]